MYSRSLLVYLNMFVFEDPWCKQGVYCFRPLVSSVHCYQLLFILCSSRNRFSRFSLEVDKSSRYMFIINSKYCLKRPYLDKNFLATTQYVIVFIVWCSLFVHVTDRAKRQETTCCITDYVYTYRASAVSILESDSRHKQVYLFITCCSRNVLL